jgi:hypothetical protein
MAYLNKMFWHSREDRETYASSPAEIQTENFRIKLYRVTTPQPAGCNFKHCYPTHRHFSSLQPFHGIFETITFYRAASDEAIASRFPAGSACLLSLN